MAKLTVIILTLSILDTGLCNWFGGPEITCNPDCGTNPYRLPLITNVTLAQQVPKSPFFVPVSEYAGVTAMYSSACDTFISIDGITTFLLFRVAVLNNGTEIYQYNLIRELRPGYSELVGYSERYGPASRVFYQYPFAVACVNQPGVIFGLYRSYCYDNDPESSITFLTSSLQVQPPASCISEIKRNMNFYIRRAGLRMVYFVDASNSRPYKCVRSYNGIPVINAGSIPDMNAIDLGR